MVAVALAIGLGAGAPAARAATMAPISEAPVMQVEQAAEDGAAPEVGSDEARARRVYYQAIREELYVLVEQEGPRVALARMRALMKDDPVLLRSCHPFMHQIGRRAYARYGSFAEAVQYRDDLCNSGYLHGVIEGHFLAVPAIRSRP